jgi:hypothetical protein
MSFSSEISRWKFTTFDMESSRQAYICMWTSLVIFLIRTIHLQENEGSYPDVPSTPELKDNIGDLYKMIKVAQGMIKGKKLEMLHSVLWNLLSTSSPELEMDSKHCPLAMFMIFHAIRVHDHESGDFHSEQSRALTPVYSQMIHG